MADTHYIWKGPSTGIEVWSENSDQKEATLLFSGQVAQDKPIGCVLPADHSQVQGWLAFNLIEETTSGEAITELKSADIKTTADIKGKKERTDG